MKAFRVTEGGRGHLSNITPDISVINFARIESCQKYHPWNYGGESGVAAMFDIIRGKADAGKEAYTALAQNGIVVFDRGQPKVEFALFDSADIKAVNTLFDNAADIASRFCTDIAGIAADLLVKQSPAQLSYQARSLSTVLTQFAVIGKLSDRAAELLALTVPDRRSVLAAYAVR